MYGKVHDASAHLMGRGAITFYFSRSTFRRMKEAGHSHYCFRCGGTIGFVPDVHGEPLDADDPEGCKPHPMKDHDAEIHGCCVIGDADRFNTAAEWLANARIPDDFPYQVVLC